MAENKVQFNLKSVHYSIVTETASTDGSIIYTYGTPVAVPGAVSLTLDPAGSVEPFYADGVVYYNAIANQGYSGDLEMARFPDTMMTAVWGFTETTDHVLIENSSAEPKAFALLYQIDGDATEQYYALYNVTGTRPGIGGSTTTDTKSPATQSSSITAAPRKDGRVFARTKDDTATATKTSWFSTVFTGS